MINPFELVTQRRDKLGKSASRCLRKLNDEVPGILYGGKEAPIPLSVKHKDLAKALENEAFYSHILTIKFEGNEQKAILRDLQRHPSKPRILHFDLLRVSAFEKIQMQVPLHFEGEEIAPGVKQSGGQPSHLMTVIEIRCLPDNLPEFINVDVSALELDSSIHLSDLQLPEGVELAMPVETGSERDLPVVSIHLPRSALAAEETAAPVAPTAPEATKQTAASEEKVAKK